MTEDNSIATLSVRYEKTPIVRALLTLIPGWGCPDTLLMRRAEELREKRLRVFFDELASGDRELSEALTDSDAFLHCYFATLSAATRTNRCDKIIMFARMLSAIRHEGNPDEIVDAYEEDLRLLDSLTPTALLLLGLAAKSYSERAPEKLDNFDGPYINDDYPTIPEHVLWNGYQLLWANELLVRVRMAGVALGSQKLPKKFVHLSDSGKSFVDVILKD